VLDVGTSEPRQEALIENGLVPIVLDSYDEIPEVHLVGMQTRSHGVRVSIPAGDYLEQNYGRQKGSGGGI
jgi:hypothetical protein